MAENPLELVPLDDLLNEVQNRVDHFVFYGRRRMTTHEQKPIYSYRRAMVGPIDALTFLAANLQHYIQKDFIEQGGQPQPWEEL